MQKHSEDLTLKKIAVIRTDFPEKFGLPRQSGLAETRGKIVFEPEYRSKDALRGLEDYSHLWLLWGFSEVKQKTWHATVRPPRLGGNTRMGVFATRSPFRPNPIGLSCVRLVKICDTEKEGSVLLVEGVDMMDAAGGFAEQHKNDGLQVEFEKNLELCVPEEHRTVLRQILAQDPRPSYQEDPERIYGMDYAGMQIRFRVADGCLRVCSVQ